MFDPIVFLMECLVFDWLCLKKLDIAYINHSLTLLTCSHTHLLTCSFHTFTLPILFGLPVHFEGVNFLSLAGCSILFFHFLWWVSKCHSRSGILTSHPLELGGWEWTHHWCSTGTLACPRCYSSLPTVTAQCWPPYDVITLSIRA